MPPSRPIPKLGAASWLNIRQAGGSVGTARLLLQPEILRSLIGSPVEIWVQRPGRPSAQGEQVVILQVEVVLGEWEVLCRRPDGSKFWEFVRQLDHFVHLS